MRQLRYDIVAHQGGYAMMITPEEADAFAAKHDAFDAAADLARKLRFVGIALDVRTDEAAARRAKAS